MHDGALSPLFRRPLEFCKRSAALRASAFGRDYLDSEYWRILNCIRRYPAGYRAGIKELESASGLPEGKLGRRLLKIQGSGWIQLDTLETTSQSNPKVLSVTALPGFQQTFDDHACEILRCFASIFLPAEEASDVGIAIDSLPRPLSDDAISMFCHPWAQYEELWRQAVRDLTAKEPWSGAVEKLRLKLLQDEIYWLVLMCLADLEGEVWSNSDWIDFNGLIKAMNDFVVAPVAKVREDLNEIVRSSQVLESEHVPGGTRRYRLSNRSHILLMTHLMAADERLRLSAATLPRSGQSAGHAHLRVIGSRTPTRPGGKSA